MKKYVYSVLPHFKYLITIFTVGLSWLLESSSMVSLLFHNIVPCSFCCVLVVNSQLSAVLPSSGDNF